MKTLVIKIISVILFWVTVSGFVNPGSGNQYDLNRFQNNSTSGLFEASSAIALQASINKFEKKSTKIFKSILFRDEVSDYNKNLTFKYFNQKINTSDYFVQKFSPFIQAHFSKDK
ncbi:MAG: hypothetical protein IPM56_08675 [Ignavibacteriales bacterium]|nr:MAG: hypothetical protein IPM56_08675 [Ignavibacteriales bacterium]